MKFSMIAASAVMAVVAGCKSLPTPDVMESTANSIGIAAGLVANATKIDDKSRNAVVFIMGEVARVVPQKGQSFEEAWTPIAKEVVAKLIAEGKLDEATGNLALGAFSIAVKGVDYIFDVRFPKARQYEELVSAAVTGFTNGFLSVFKPVDGSTSRSSAKADKDAYEWLKARAK